MTGKSMSGGLGEYGRCGGVCSETIRCCGLRQGGRCGGVVKRDQIRAPPSLRVACVLDGVTGAGVEV
jgi:hypothetical protein